MVLLCISLGAIGLTQVSIWSSTQDLRRAATGIVSGWTGGWSGALLGIALAGTVGAVLWLFVYPERALAALEQPMPATI